MQSSATAAAATASASAAATRREALNDSLAAGNGCGRLGTPSTSSVRDDFNPPSPTVTHESSTMAAGSEDDGDEEKRLARQASTKAGANGFGDVFPSQPRVMLPNLVLIILGVVLFSMCYFILQEEIRVKAFEASRRARMSISHYTDLLLNISTRSNPWSRRNSPSLEPDNADFARWKKRRESAPAVTTMGTGIGTSMRVRIVSNAIRSNEL